MSKSDDEIQKILEDGLNQVPDDQRLEESEDMKLYSRLFEELNTEPEVRLSYSFSANVLRKVKHQQQRRSEIRLTILVLTSIIIGFVGFANSIYFKDMLKTFSGNTSIFVVGLLLLLVIQFLDQKLVIERRLPK